VQEGEIVADFVGVEGHGIILVGLGAEWEVREMGRVAFERGAAMLETRVCVPTRGTRSRGTRSAISSYDNTVCAIWRK